MPSSLADPLDEEAARYAIAQLMEGELAAHEVRRRLLPYLTALSRYHRMTRRLRELSIAADNRLVCDDDGAYANVYELSRSRKAMWDDCEILSEATIIWAAKISSTIFPGSTRGKKELRQFVEWRAKSLQFLFLRYIPPRDAKFLRDRDIRNKIVHEDEAEDIRVLRFQGIDADQKRMARTVSWQETSGDGVPKWITKIYGPSEFVNSAIAISSAAETLESALLCYRSS